MINLQKPACVVTVSLEITSLDQIGRHMPHVSEQDTKEGLQAKWKCRGGGLLKQK